MPGFNPELYFYVAFFNSNSENLSGNVFLGSNDITNTYHSLTVLSEYQDGVSVGSEIQFQVDGLTTYNITVPETSESTLQLTLFYTETEGETSGTVNDTISIPILANDIQSQIDRLTTAKESIATFITNNGITIPFGTKLDGMATLLYSISGDGGVGVGLNYIHVEFLLSPYNEYTL